MLKKNEKISILRNVTQKQEVINNVLAYCENAFIKKQSRRVVPIDNESSIRAWIEYQRKGENYGVHTVLKSTFAQLQFPIEEGISKTDAYINATRRGITPLEFGKELQLNHPEQWKLSIHTTLAGKVPILIIPDKEDFKNTIRALLYKNEPSEIPESMGAVMISGLNNWHRLHQYREEWVKRNPFGNWNNEFKINVIPNKHLYQDKLILLSNSFYSNVSNQDLKISEDTWLKYSLQIRLEHECTHLYTKRYLENMRNNIHDELIADYMGITNVLGQFRADWFLKFMGLDHFPAYTSGQRFENYIDKKWIGREEFKILAQIVYHAAFNVEEFDNRLGIHKSDDDRKYRLLSLCAVDLITMSTGGGVDKLVSHYHQQNS